MTTRDNYSDRQLVPPLTSVEFPDEGEEVEEVEELVEDSEEGDLTYLTDLSPEDREQLFGVGNLLDTGGGEEDLSDLIDVDSADIMDGLAPEAPPKRYRVTQRGRRVIRRPSLPPPSGMGGVRP